MDFLFDSPTLITCPVFLKLLPLHHEFSAQVSKQMNQSPSKMNLKPPENS